MNAFTETPDPNPYAPSAVLDPREELAAAGVGVWRDGRLVVLHRDAPLPAICFKTGRPATHWFTYYLAWNRHFFSSHVEQLRLRVPLCRWRHNLTRLRWILLGLGLAVLALLAWWAPNLHLLPDPYQALVVFGLGSLMVTLILTGVALGEPVQLRRYRGNYLWLSGAGEKFLVHLPAWPLGS